jgi:hypothetical protein
VASFRIRKLTKTGKGDAQVSPHLPHGGGLVVNVSHSAGAVFEIDAQETELDEREIRVALLDGTLRSSDLLFFEQKWQSLLDAPLFLDEATIAQRRERRVLFVRSAGLALLAFGLIVLLFGGRVWLRR